MKYKVELTRKTHSRYGSYIYKHRLTVDAETAEQAKTEALKQFSSPNGGQGKLHVTRVYEAEPIRLNAN